MLAANSHLLPRESSQAREWNRDIYLSFTTMVCMRDSRSVFFWPPLCLFPGSYICKRDPALNIKGSWRDQGNPMLLELSGMDLCMGPLPPCLTLPNDKLGRFYAIKQTHSLTRLRFSNGMLRKCRVRICLSRVEWASFCWALRITAGGALILWQ